MRRRLLGIAASAVFAMAAGAVMGDGDRNLERSPDPSVSPREKLRAGVVFKLESPTAEARAAWHLRLAGVQQLDGRYEIVDVGTFGSPGSPTGANAIGLNELGHVVGLAEDDNLAFGNHAFFYRDGELIDLGYLFDGSTYSYAKGVNDLDQVVGQSLSRIPGGGGASTGAPFLWNENDGMTMLAPEEVLDFPFGWSWGINNAGQASLTAGFRPYWWDPVLGFTAITFPNEQDTTGEAWEINNAGVVVGSLDDDANDLHAFRYDTATGSLEDLHDAVTYVDTEAYGLNDDGDVVGWGSRHDGTFRAMLWPHEGGAIELPWGDIDPVYTWSIAQHVNGHGDIVGKDDGPGLLGVGWVLFDVTGGGPMQKVALESLLSEEDQAEWLLAHAFEINDSGQIVGIGLRDIGLPDLVTRAFLMTPVGCLETVYGLLSDLRIDGGFRQAVCLGTFSDPQSVVETVSSLPETSSGDGYYYLWRGSCGAGSYGDSNLSPDPRDELDSQSPCP